MVPKDAKTSGWLVAGLVVLVGCAGGGVPDVATMGGSEPGALPVMRWDAERPPAEAREWSRAALQALETHGAVLPSMEPGDIAAWCPAYPAASQEDRRAFWAGLFSALAKHESTWNPEAVGGGGRWFGLLQISPATARNYGCGASSGEALKNGAANLSCAVRIASHTVARDGVVAANGRGIAADWAPFQDPAKRRDMADWVSAQGYCRKG